MRRAVDPFAEKEATEPPSAPRNKCDKNLRPQSKLIFKRDKFDHKSFLLNEKERSIKGLASRHTMAEAHNDENCRTSEVGKLDLNYRTFKSIKI